MKILITGASGYLGSHLTKKLAADGHTVITLLLRETSSLARLSSCSSDCLIERYVTYLKYIILSKELIQRL